MTSQTLEADPRLQARQLLKSLQEKYTVFKDFKPLAIGIDRQLLAQETGIDRKRLRWALGMHTHSSRYLKTMERASQRFNLDGSLAGEIPDEHRQHATDKLRERFKNEAERRKAEQEAQEAEKRRTEKLQQLVQKFTK